MATFTTPGLTLSILVVDDVRDTSDSLAKILRFNGHTVQVAYNTDMAVALADADPPDVVVTDIAMPGESGFSLIRRIRESGHRPLMIAVTGLGDESTRERCRYDGFDHVFIKPADPNELIDLLAQHEQQFATA